MGAIDEYEAVGGMQGMAARKLHELLTTASHGHPLAEVAALMRGTNPPSLDTWGQVLPVIGDLFGAAAENTTDLDPLLEKHPPHLVALAMILLADLEGLPDLLSGPLQVFLNGLQFNRLVTQVLAGDESGVIDLETSESRFVYMQVQRRLGQSDAAKKPRPRKEPTLRSEFMRAMKLARMEGRNFDQFIESLKEQSGDGLELKDGPPGSALYELGADAIEEWEQLVPRETLKDWWKKSQGGLAG